MLNVDQHNSNIKQQKPMTCEVASHFILGTLQLYLVGFKKDSEEHVPVINFSQLNATQTFKWTNQNAKAVIEVVVKRGKILRAFSILGTKPGKNLSQSETTPIFKWSQHYAKASVGKYLKTISRLI